MVGVLVEIHSHMAKNKFKEEVARTGQKYGYKDSQGKWVDRAPQPQFTKLRKVTGTEGHASES